MKVIYSKFQIKRSNRINILKTVLINFLSFPFNIAIKFPILIYGPLKLQNIMGQIELRKEIRRGMLKIGLSDSVRSSNSKSFISIRGKLQIGNNVILRRGINLSIKSDATLRLDDDVFISDNNTIICFNNIWIKKATRIGNNTTIMDSDFHYIVNLNSHEIKSACLPIIIGENNWIGGWCTIKKGTQTPMGTIVAGPYSFLGKNYINIIPEFSLIAGLPAKLLIERVRSVNNKQSEDELSKYFKETNSNYVLPDDVDLDEFCMP